MEKKARGTCDWNDLLDACIHYYSGCSKGWQKNGGYENGYGGSSANDYCPRSGPGGYYHDQQYDQNGNDLKRPGKEMGFGPAMERGDCVAGAEWWKAYQCCGMDW